MNKKLLPVIALVILVTPLTVSATPGIMKKFITTYPDVRDSQLDSCRTCHLPAEKDCLNGYALALRENSLDFKAIEEQDSDGDGTANSEEIMAGQLPGSQALADEVFVFTTSLGDITFDHEKHSLAEPFLSEGRCANCHDGEQAFPRKFDDTVSWQKIAHPICRSCHKESGSENAPTRCFSCHIKRVDEDDDGDEDDKKK